MKMKIGRKTIEVYSKNFEYYQPNKHSCGDCALRAVSKVLNKDWNTVFDDLVTIAKKKQLMPNDTKVIEKYLSDNGFKWTAISVPKGSVRPIVSEFAKKNPNKLCVLRVSHHLTSCSNGKFYDIWDCGNKSIYGYWEKK